jgi:excisionase family DNA binding protein
MDKIMTLEEVAEYLRVAERTVADWAAKGELPGGKIGTSWRFKSGDVEDWLNNKLSPRIKKDLSTYKSLKPLISSSRTARIESELKTDVLNEMINLFKDVPGINSRAEIANAIFEREEIMSTGIGLSIAIPHCRLNGIKDISIAIGVTANPIEDYPSIDDKAVRIVIMILAGRNQHTEYIKVLAMISSFLKNEERREMLLKAETKEEILSVFLKGEK